MFVCDRFKLILGFLQLDNQLPLTVMPVLLAPEHMIDSHHPVFKMTITMSNKNIDEILVYPCVYVRVRFLEHKYAYDSCIRGRHGVHFHVFIISSKLFSNAR